MRREQYKLYEPYKVFVVIYTLFLVVAFGYSSPEEICQGMRAIIVSKSVLVTDYIAVAGIGATLVNVVLIGGASLLLLIRAGVRPDGSTIMALWLTTGFAFFGKNIFNMIPITFGVWLYARYQRQPFRNYSVVALLSATISPLVSEIAFLGAETWGHPVFAFAAGISGGIIAGFIFPAVAAACNRVHDGYNLYNLGFAGGLISSFFLALLGGLGLDVESVLIWSTGNNLVLGIMLYVLSAGLILYGIWSGKRNRVFHDLKAVMEQPGRLATDFYAMYGNNIYINMGIMGALGTSIVLITGADLNGPTISGILTMVGFGCFGKHLKNCIPVICGALLGTLTNVWDITSASNILAILFVTGLAPIAGRFGFFWGVVAGFLHVNFAIHIRFLNSGMNLYNNGFVAGFVALLLVPVITALRREN